MKPEAFFDVAEGLLAVGCEASCRSAASRVYYSTFHVARDATEQVDLIDPPRGSHQLVRAKVGKRFGRRMQNTLRTMSARRNEADYDIDEPFGKDDAVQLIELRRLFLEELASRQNR
ncbi:HEPN domain-containing protein [Halomonas alkalisoli]|uniref:HEPN domain-containing protein n=1 Tax=Halomonas alkalisoli TaxID=2907158 RepID=UPI001F21AEF6|nr:HEPN domain-containing protein [Halomonas alkalisoli]MCE9681963.1 HEPN domain-containing protein [Halomonas alkalisoli]